MVNSKKKLKSDGFEFETIDFDIKNFKKKKPDVQMKILELELELSKMNREKSIILLNKALFMYFIFIVVAVFGILNGYSTVFYSLIVMSFLVLLVGTYPYIRTMYYEEKKISNLIKLIKENL
jgi:hypothetical protein